MIQTINENLSINYLQAQKNFYFTFFIKEMRKFTPCFIISYENEMFLKSQSMFNTEILIQNKILCRYDNMRKRLFSSKNKSINK